MSDPVERAIKVLEAEYVPEAQSILIVGECQEGRLRTQINRSCFSYGTRTEEEIIEELDKTATMMIGKTIKMVFDEDLNIDGKNKVSLKIK